MKKRGEQRLFKKVFINSILWRSPNSCTEKTFELLRQVPQEDFISPSLDILLKFSVQPEHPWNADLLHKKLVNKTLSERDKSWSIHVASSYQSEKTFTIAHLIDWPDLNDLKNLEPECARLYAITLIWLTTTSYREVRDKATKSAIIILSKHPEHLLELMDSFSKVNDLYVLERLYAIVYGVIVNISNKELISKVAEKTYRRVFSTGKPIPHILLRDYARCILEFAYHQKLLPDDINPNDFRPLYESNWPIENPMDSEINALVDDKKFGSVHYSLMGFSGDFGIYTMGCIHSFSHTPIKNSPETGEELQKQFIDKLNDKQKTLYYGCSEKYNLIQKQQARQINNFKENFKSETGKEFDEEYIDMIRVDRKDNCYDKYLKRYNDLTEKYRKQLLEKKNKFIENLSEEQREYYRWLFDDRFMGNRPAAFSRKWAKRWVCKQVYEMGWKKELFEEFEQSMCSRGRGSENVIERIGKKYQWIAFHKLLAHLTDNVHYIDGYDNKNKYEGPWQLSKREIDPTCYLRKTKSDSDFRKNVTECWWYPYVFEFPKKNIERQEEWLKSINAIPPFKDLLQIKNPNDNNLWTVLHGFVNQEEISHNKKEDLYRPVCWFRISAIIIHKKDYETLYEKLKNKDLRNPHISEGGGSIGRFLREYPFYEKDCNNGWQENLSGNDVHLQVKHLCPTMEYHWESGNDDHSIDESIHFYLPSKTLISKLNLYYPPQQFENWVDKNGIQVFKSPSITSKGPSYAMIRTDALNTWLTKENLCMVWIIGGEKQLFYGEGDIYKINEFSGVYSTMCSNKIKGDMWFLKIRERNGSNIKIK